MSRVNGEALSIEATTEWTLTTLTERLEEGRKEMQDLSSEGSVHLGRYYLLQGSILTASYQLSSSDSCYLFRWLILSTLFLLGITGFPYLRKSYKYMEAKNRCNEARLKYAFQQDTKMTGAYKVDSVGNMWNYVTLFGGSLLLILASTIIFLFLGHYFLCDKKLVDFQKHVVINNPIIRFDNVGGCFSLCNDQDKCFKACAV